MRDPARSRLLNLDILRLLSAIMVLAFHYGFRMEISGEGGGVAFPELSHVAMWFDAGLLIFFAISGYVIAMSADGQSSYDFAVGRFARLWPTFVVCATATAAVLLIWPVPTLEPPSMEQWLAHVVIVSRALGQPFLDGAYWTITYEIVFYGWVFMLMVSGLLENRWRTAALVWLAISAANEVVVGSGAIQKLLITEYSGYFVFGLSLYKLRQRASAADLLVLGAAACWAAITPFLTETDFVRLYGLNRPVIGLAVMGPAVLLLVAGCALAPSLPIRASLAMGLGGLTYPLYLLHQNIGYAIFARFGTDQNRWLLLSVILVILLTASWAFARWLEPAARRALRRAAGIPTRLSPSVLRQRQAAQTASIETNLRRQ